MNAKNYGEMMACLEHEVPPATYPFHKAAAEQLGDPFADNYGSLQKVAAHMAAEMYASSGQQVSKEFFLFDGLRKVALWLPELDQFTDPVFRALCGQFSGSVKQAREEVDMDKQAFMSSVLGLLGKGITATPTLAKTLVAGGAATGAGLGALYWGLNRHSTEDDDKAEAIKARLKLYRRITAEISEDLKRNQTLPTESPRNIIAQDAGTNNIF